MSKTSILNEIDAICNFSELYLRNIPDKQTMQLRTKHLREITGALDDDFENQQTVLSAASGLQQFLTELELLDRHNPQLREDKIGYTATYKEHITMLKHVISTLRLNVLLGDLTAIVNNN